jgi:Protein of unknown function (DUF2846)
LRPDSDWAERQCASGLDVYFKHYYPQKLMKGRTMNLQLIKRVSGWLLMLSLIILGGCATAPGPAFTAIEAPSAGKGALYVYRTERIFAMAQAFTVSIDQKKTGEIQNASYLRRELAPGKYKLTVAPGGFAKTFDTNVQIEAGQTLFYEFDFNSGPIANAFFIGSEILRRDEAKALADLRTCKRAE